MFLMLRWANRLASSLIVLVALSAAAYGAETYNPIRLTAASQIIFPADARLNLGQAGTIEFWLSATSDSDETQCVMRMGEDDKLDFAILMHPKRESIYLQTRSGTISGRFKFSDGAFHHVAFVTSGGATTVLIDGVKPTMPSDEPGVDIEMPDARMQFGQAGAEGQPLALGCDEPRPFEGWLYSLRFWDKALTADELASVRPFYGLPVPGSFDNLQQLNSENLVAYSTFSTERRSLHYREAAILAETMSLKSNHNADVMLLRRSFLPDDFGLRRLTRIFWQNGPSGFRNLKFEFSRTGSIPVLLPRPANWSPERQQRLLTLDKDFQRSTGVNDAEAERFTSEAYILQDAYNPNTAEGLRSLGITAWNVLDLQEGEEIQSIAGVHDTGEITTLRFFTNMRTFNSPLMGQSAGSSEIFHLKPAAFSKFEGLATELSPDESGRLKLTSISLLSSTQDIPDEIRPLVELTKGLWIEKDGCAPRLNDEMAFQKNHRHPTSQNTFMHGLYTTPTVVKYLYDPVSRRLTQWTDRQLAFGKFKGDSGACGAAQVGAMVLESADISRFSTDGANVLRSVAPGGRTARVVLAKNGTEIATQDGGENVPGPFVRVESGIATNKDKIAWGGTFSLPHRPPNVRSNFTGYDITQLDPHNFLKSHGIKSPVFEYPDETSTDYETADNNLIIPHGLIYKNVSTGAEDARTIMTAGSAEYQRAWAVSLGLNLGFGVDGFDAAYSANYSQSERVKNRDELELITSITRTNAVRYAMVADRSRIKLSSDFRQDVLALRDALLVGRDASMAGFIAKYGTHYPYAVTYGGMAFLETTYSKEVVDHMVEKNRSFEQSTNLSFAEKSKSNGCGCDSGGGGGLTGSLGVNSSISSTSSLATEIRNSDESRLFGTYGGSVTKGEGWSLSAGDEVPLLFDLRPLPELLSPLYFDDPEIWNTVRPRLMQKTRLHLQNSAANSRAAPPAWYVTGRPGYVAKQPLVFDQKHQLQPDAKHPDDK